jgi:hypothetical protein
VKRKASTTRQTIIASRREVSPSPSASTTPNSPDETARRLESLERQVQQYQLTVEQFHRQQISMQNYIQNMERNYSALLGALVQRLPMSQRPMFNLGNGTGCYMRCLLMGTYFELTVSGPSSQSLPASTFFPGMGLPPQSELSPSPQSSFRPHRNFGPGQSDPFEYSYGSYSAVSQFGSGGGAYGPNWV